MNRRSFITKMLGLGSLISLPPLELLKGEEKKKFNCITDTTSVHLYDCYVRGMRYYKGKKYLYNMNPGDTLDLVREADNRYDTFAVEIYWKGRKLGYLPKFENRALANLIDNKMFLKSRIKALYPERELWEACEVEVDLVIPTNPEFEKWIANKAV